MQIRPRISATLRRLVEGLTGKQWYNLERFPRSLTPGATGLLPVRYQYRATPDGRVNYTLLKGCRQGSYRLHALEFPDSKYPKAGRLSFAYDLPPLQPEASITVNLLEPSLSLNGAPVVPTFAQRIEARKFIADIQLISHTTERHSRICAHYLPYDNKPITRDYYFGDDYANYPLQTATNDAVALVKKYKSYGRLLDVGCALGIYTKAFLDAGFDAYGVDISEFGIGEACLRVGTDRVRHQDIDVVDIPFVGDFDAFWMWDILEHLSAPEAALAKITRKANPGATLFLHTSNADSLTHRVFGKNWEGYTDYSHHGVEQITCAGLRAWLAGLGWKIIEWECYDLWTRGVDPVPLRLNEAFKQIPELRALLLEAELGDFIQVVARKN